MDILAVYGSPRKGGNTDTLLDAFVQGAEAAGADVRRIYVRELDISCCRGCRACETAGRCVVDDDMQKIYPLLAEARALVLASPIFFYSVAGCAKIIIDRSQALWARKYVLNDPLPEKVEGVVRLGYFLSCGATKGKNLFDGSLLTMKYFFDAASFRQAESLTYRRIEKPGEVEKHPSAIAEAKALGEKAGLRASGKEFYRGDTEERRGRGEEI